MTVRVVETLESRLNILIDIVRNICPGLTVSSKYGQGILGHRLPVLAFKEEQGKIKGFWNSLFGRSYPAPEEAWILSITCPGNSALSLDDRWKPIAIHVHRRDFVRRAEQIAEAYEKETRQDAEVVLEA